MPRVNLTSNIGIYGLHARGKSEHHFRPYDADFVFNKHPEKMKCWTEYDVHHFTTYIFRPTPFYKRVRNKIKRIIARVKN